MPSNSRLPEIPISRLLKSWASPPASCPTASIFWLWRKVSSACSRASAWARSALTREVVSMTVSMMPTTTPRSSRTGL
ncbi:hypothetical protein G6F68_019171 [Rhizopus microsporus]|nr:hypothetical protein G6F68_019171 [Rhizopus microsporus]